MGIGRYFLHDFFTARELNELDEKLEARRRVDSDRHANTGARISGLEADLGRVALLARSLADLCISKELLTREELSKQFLEADLADGMRDHRLEPKVVMPGESKPADPKPLHGDAPPAPRSKLKRRRPYP